MQCYGVLGREQNRNGMIGDEIPNISVLLPRANCQTREEEKIRAIEGRHPSKIAREMAKTPNLVLLVGVRALALRLCGSTVGFSFRPLWGRLSVC
jgi:hypothetical protein